MREIEMKTKSSNSKKSAEPNKNINRLTSITFGSVTVNVRLPTAGELKTRVTQSHHIMQRLKNIVSKPGVRLSIKKSTPIYTVDNSNPDLVIRKIGNEKVRGQFKNGKFVAIGATMRKRHTAKELNGQCDFSAPMPQDVCDWEKAPKVGKETL